ncbi:hypothetical protein VQ02_01130 [Methylobacterium variabile]|jgi:hypothetical protein|uniref:Uncharacterized protein n=1 Tax=Methylobacterium variabile TaxID=298794 RepID=A0A0J6VUK2_9HYPH|nr:hypothetical protein VQ02_01130 [Methylobacterium variabile]
MRGEMIPVISGIAMIDGLAGCALAGRFYNVPLRFRPGVRPTPHRNLEAPDTVQSARSVDVAPRRPALVGRNGQARTPDATIGAELSRRSRLRRG